MNLHAAKSTFGALNRIIDDDAYANLALRAESDALVTSWVYTTLEHFWLLDAWISRLTQGKRVQRVTKQVLRMGLTAIMFMRASDASVCFVCVELMKQSGKKALSGFVNSVLRSAAAHKELLAIPQDDGVSSLSIRYNWPISIIAMWQRTYGEAVTKKILEYASEPDTVIRVNPLAADEARALDALREQFVFRRGKICPAALHLSAAGGLTRSELFLSGIIAVQGEGAMLAARAVEARPGLRVLDACAAPGGKSAYMAAEMQNRGEIIAWDIHAHRVSLIEATAKRLNASIVNAGQHDALVFAPELERAMDAVLVDAPCSGLGVAWQKPDIRIRARTEDSTALVQTQRGILDTCARYVRPGGALVYATCTISAQENEEVAGWFSETHTDFAPDDLSRFFPEEFPKARLNGGQAQLFPHLDDTEGFFIARWSRL